MWLNNARMIEALKGWVGARLERGEFEGGDGEQGEGEAKAGGEKMEGVDDDGLYPSLRL